MAPTEVNPPEWLDKEFIQQVMRKALNNETWTIKTCDIKPALGPGENYSSIIFRTKLVVTDGSGNTENLSLILKSLPAGDLMQQAMHEAQMFLKEGKILYELIPEVHKLLPEYKVIGPKCYFFQGEPTDLIIMEDLCSKGYKMGDRFSCLNLDESILVVQNLATYHNAMRVLLKNKPEIRENFELRIWGEENNEKSAKMISSTFTGLAEVAEKWEDFPKSIVQKLHDLATTSQSKENPLWVVDESFKLNTLTHGDCWVNNMMFKHDSEGKVTEQIFIDFQLSSYNSPILDLHYFLFTSVKHEVRNDHLETIKQAYYNELTSLLSVSEPELKFTYEDFENEFRRTMFHGLLSAVLLFPIISAPPKDALDVNELLDETATVNNNHLFQNERVKQVFKQLLPYFEKEGVL